MTNIYKREPKLRSLPTGWANMDAVKLSNINSIQGLQHVDNALAAEQNSTYNCKNVYQDESGNLTVRPALRHLETFEGNVLRYYKTSKGIIYHIEADGNYYIRQGSTSEQIGSGLIAVQESDTDVYIMYTDTAGKLKFEQWNDGFVAFEPDILTNNQSDLSAHRFNLLTDKYYSHIPTATSKPSLDLPPEDYEETFEAILEINKPIDHRVYLLGSQYIIADNILYVIGPKVYTFPLPENASSYFIYLYNEKVYLNIYAEGTIYMYIVTSTLTPDGRYSVSGYESCQPLYFNKALCFKDDTYYVINFVTGAKNYTWEISQTSPSPVYTADSVYFIEYMPTGGTVSQINFTRYDYNRSQAIDLVVGQAVTPSKITPFSSYRACGYHLGDESGDERIVFGSGSNIYNKAFIVRYIAGQPYSSDTMATFAADSAWKQYIELYNFDENTGFTSTKISSEYSEGGVYENGGILFVRSRDIEDRYYFVKRTVKGSLLELFRPISEDFPVLSDIEDEVLTSFYLDNIYWFITKHRVFGTGVADEHFSIKYFDPRKYFYFEETLTGAIRISDTSFWVFHNNGAYLIYKGSSNMYDSTSDQYIEVVTWLCTSTAESKGCDFDNAVMTLPVSNYVACVTSDDISSVQMRENVQTDDRILVPMTLGIRKFVSSLLNETNDIVTATFKYNALFFLNKSCDSTSVLVYNATTNSWWYWELPVARVQQVYTATDNIEILAKTTDGTVALYDLYTDYYEYHVGGLTWELYADRVLNNEPTKIEWFWESAILHFDTTDYKKQLLLTTFAFSERESSTVSFEYNFEVYDREYSERNWSEVTQIIERAKTYSCKNIVGKFMYLQLYMKNLSGNDFETYTKPKFSAISFKYRLLLGGNL